MIKNFAIIGIAGYIAPKHLKAIKDINANLLASLDPFDSVGIIDSFFPESHYFKDSSEFENYILNSNQLHKSKIDFISICTPNHLHESHIKMSLRLEADSICEKPLVLDPFQLDILQKIENDSNNRIWTILQLRVHPSLLDLKRKVNLKLSKKNYKIRLTYITSRGNWYYKSWKGDIEKSGGITTNIGIHFFDMLLWIFGKEVYSELHFKTENRIGGFLELENANVEWYLSLEPSDIPFNEGLLQRTFRSISVDKEEFEFSGGFTELHSNVYKKTVEGNGFSIDDARPAIELTHKIRNLKTKKTPKGTIHPLVKKFL
jgi:UDP-N-acetyl-2-amino-2-deoxyglucuronate dehydrogenase